MENTTKPAYLDSSLSTEARVADLLSRMTLEEKVSQMGSHSPAIERLGIPAYSWHNECLHGLVHTGKATCFPQAIGLAATFNTKLIEQVADAIASEARAKFHDPIWWRDGQPRVGINFWTPVVNLFRDPRWGRGQETYGEDPYLSGLLGAAFVRGLQGSHPKYMKAAACAKHFAVHSGPERIRGSFDAVVSPKDLRETYLPQFKMLVDAGVETIMGAYNRVNGEPSCGSKTLLTDILRDEWGFKGHVVSDGGAIQGSHNSHKVTADEMGSAVLGASTGCDMDNSYPTAYRRLPEAIQQGKITEAEIDKCVVNILGTRFKLGMFDGPAENPYTKIDSSVIQCAKHQRINHQATVESIVMLKNSGVLPLGPNVKTIAVVGPSAADVQVLLGNFYRGVTGKGVTILEGIVAAAPDGVAVTHMPGTYHERPPVKASNWHEGLCEWADVIVAAVGISPLMEGEGGECIGSITGERDELVLPEHQMAFLRRLKKLGKPLVVIVTGGSPVAMPEVQEMADAILFAWYPGEHGGTAVAEILFGRANPSGRLPITFPTGPEQLPPFEDYSMVGRTYRYMTAEPLYPFGFGLSYTRFEYGPITLSAAQVKRRGSLSAEVEVKNVGTLAGDEVVQLYITDDQASTRTPRWSLRGVKRVHLEPGASAKVKFKITREMMELIDEAGKAVLEPGTFTVTIGGSSPGSRSEALGAPKPATASFELR